MSQHVLITGTGRPYALGFNLVKFRFIYKEHIILIRFIDFLQ